MREQPRFTARALRGVLGYARFGEPEYRLLPSFVTHGATAIDVGAHLGAYSWRLASLVGRHGRVLTIEPHPQLAAQLRSAAATLRLSQIEVHQVAVGASTGRSSLVVPRHDGVPDLGYSHLGEGGIPVVVETLDNLAARAPSRIEFLKIDAEGAESQILRGARALLAEHRPVLLLELEERWANRYGDSAQAVMDDLVATFEYRPCVLADGALRTTRAVDPAINNYLFLARA
jgi:FkbM family methyltransferase